MMKRSLASDALTKVRAARVSILVFGGLLLPSCTALAAPAVEHLSRSPDRDFAGRTGMSAIWMWANIAYAGMRAQGSASRAWRVVAFIFGFPGTLLSLLVVPEGSQRAYGVDLPKRDTSNDSSAAGT